VWDPFQRLVQHSRTEETAFSFGSCRSCQAESRFPTQPLIASLCYLLQCESAKHRICLDNFVLRCVVVEFDLYWKCGAFEVLASVRCEAKSRMLKICVPVCSFAEFGPSSMCEFFNSIFTTVTPSDNVVQPCQSCADLRFQWPCRLVLSKAVLFWSRG
jgi:hypothetical protein